MMAFVDDAGVVVGLARVVAVERCHRIGELAQQLVLDDVLDQDVVGRHAGLAGVEELRPRDALRRDLDVRIGGDDRRALATQFERDRREVFCRSAHHHAADLAVAGVEDVIEAFLQQGRGLVDTAGDDRNRRTVEVPGDELLDQRRHRGSDLGGLQHRSVARRQCRHERSEQQLDRVVPRGDDADRAERLGPQRRLAGLERQRHPDLLRSGPRIEVLEGVIDLVDREGDLGRVRLDARLADVGDQRVDEPVLFLDEQLAEPLQLDAARLDIAQYAGSKPGLEFLDDVGDAVHGSHRARLRRQLG